MLKTSLSRKLIATVAAVVALSLLHATPALAAVQRIYQNWNSGKCMDVSNGGSANGTVIWQWTCDLLNQNQLFVNNSSGFQTYIFKNPRTGKCIDGFRGHGNDIVLWTCDGTTTQIWGAVQLQRPGEYRFYNLQTNECIAVKGAGTASGVHIINWTCQGTTSQYWSER